MYAKPSNSELIPASFLQDISNELDTILHFWASKMTDNAHGGFVGAMDHAGIVNEDAPKGVVLNARILWTFSAAALFKNGEVNKAMAHRAFEYFIQTFFDKEFGGVYWSVTSAGQPLETKKQVYAQSFSIYALAAYYELTKDERALSMAIELYRLIEKYSRDNIHGGYLEAFARNWSSLDDLRLSDKDANEKKTMNTHLHVLEAYTQLYRVWPQPELGANIEALLNVFFDHIINRETATQGLFFTEEWERRDTLVSYGHDIESSWLLQEAAEVLGNEKWMGITKKMSVRMAAAAAKGIDKDGGMWHEYDFARKHLVHEKHWWPQAEAMVGFCNAWQNSGDERLLEYMLNAWYFIQHYLLDKSLGEWRWGVLGDYSVMDNEDFAGLWKCPYHNGRACIEILKRLSA